MKKHLNIIKAPATVQLLQDHGSQSFVLDFSCLSCSKFHLEMENGAVQAGFQFMDSIFKLLLSIFQLLFQFFHLFLCFLLTFPFILCLFVSQNKQFFLSFQSLTQSLPLVFLSFSLLLKTELIMLTISFPVLIEKLAYYKMLANKKNKYLHFAHNAPGGLLHQQAYLH